MSGCSDSTLQNKKKCVKAAAIRRRLWSGRMNRQRILQRHELEANVHTWVRYDAAHFHSTRELFYTKFNKIFSYTWYLKFQNLYKFFQFFIMFMKKPSKQNFAHSVKLLCEKTFTMIINRSLMLSSIYKIAIYNK